MSNCLQCPSTYTCRPKFTKKNSAYWIHWHFGKVQQFFFSIYPGIVVVRKFLPFKLNSFTRMRPNAGLYASHKSFVSTATLTQTNHSNDHNHDPSGKRSAKNVHITPPPFICLQFDICICFHRHSHMHNAVSTVRPTHVCCCYTRACIQKHHTQQAHIQRQIYILYTHAPTVSPSNSSTTHTHSHIAYTRSWPTSHQFTFIKWPWCICKSCLLSLISI